MFIARSAGTRASLFTRGGAWGLAGRTVLGTALALACTMLGACTRAGVSALLPRVSLGVLGRRTAHWIATERAASERWHAVVLLSLQFRPRGVAAEVPLRTELAPATWIAPCDADDFICLQEAADAEEELRGALGELQ